MKRILTAVAVFSTVALVGCEQEPKTVDYYIKHQDEMKTVLDDCKNKAINPFGDTKEAQNCRAAADAQTQIFFTLPWEKKRKEMQKGTETTESTSSNSSTPETSAASTSESTTKGNKTVDESPTSDSEASDIATESKTK